MTLLGALALALVTLLGALALALVAFLGALALALVAFLGALALALVILLGELATFGGIGWFTICRFKIPVYSLYLDYQAVVFRQSACPFVRHICRDFAYRTSQLCPVL